MPNWGCSAVADADAAVRPVLKSTTWIRPSSERSTRSMDPETLTGREVSRHGDVERQLGGCNGATGGRVPREQCGDHLVDTAALVDALVVRGERHGRPDLVHERPDLALVTGHVPSRDRLRNGVHDQPHHRCPAGRVAGPHPPIEEPPQRAVAEGCDGGRGQPQRTRGVVGARHHVAGGRISRRSARSQMLGRSLSAHPHPARQRLRPPPPRRIGSGHRTERTRVLRPERQGGQPLDRSTPQRLDAWVGRSIVEHHSGRSRRLTQRGDQPLRGHRGCGPSRHGHDLLAELGQEPRGLQATLHPLRHG